MKLFSFLKAERSGVTEKEKDKSKPGASVGSGLFDAPTSDEHKAYIPNFLYKPPFGYPLKKNVMMLKELARNPFIFSVIRTLKDEASTSKWEIRLKKEHASSEFTSAHDDDINRVSEFFYKPNGNGESFGELIGQWVQDLCETDAAVGVKVFNKRGEFSQLFARDGSSFLKNPDIYGYMGNRADFVSPMADMNPNLAMPDKIKIYGAQYSTSAAFFQYGWTGNALPVPFGKREIMYIMSNPRSDSIYGRSPMEVIQDVLLTLVYGVRYNMDYFLNGNMPDGIVNLVGADEEVAKSFQDRLKEKFTSPDSLGNRNVRRGHVYPVWGGPEVKFEPFQISSKDMEILEQQKWFTKLVWSAFGVTPDEMGYCYSEDTRVLTNNGLKYYWEINDDDLIATVVNKKIEYIKPDKIHTFEVENREFHYYKNNCVDALVSDNHRMLYRTDKVDEWKCLPSNELNFSRVKFLQGGLEWEGEDKEFFDIPLIKYENNKDVNRYQQIRFETEKWLEFLGYYLSEGSVCKNINEKKSFTIKISQTIKESVDTMTPLLSEMGFRRKKDCWYLNNKSLAKYLLSFGNSGEKFIPDEIKKLPKHKLRILLDALVVGDGWVNEDTGFIRYSTNSKRLRDDVFELFLKLGYKPSISVVEFKNDNWNTNYIINANTTQLEPRVDIKNQRFVEKYSGIMWCPSVKNRPFITERNGKVGIHFNTEDSNKAVSQTQIGVHKRKALKPLLVKIEYVINTQLMPELDPTGTLEFKFEDYDLDNDLKQHELYEKQINMGIKTAEMVAEEEGIDVERLKKEKEESKQEMLEEQGGSEDDDDWGFDSDDVGIKHKYVRREGSPGNYTYYYKDGSSSKESNENKEIKEKGSFLGVCDRVRQTETGEKFWQEMMKNKKKIDEKEFLKNVDIKKVLDEDESWNEYRDTLEQEQEGEKLEYYKSGDYVYFFKTSGSNGFEFIWSKKPINLKHKYVRREGSPGNYTYYYDEPKSTTNTKTQEANKTIKEYKEYHDNMISELKKSFENRNVYGRVKEKESIIGKLKRKPDTYKSINDIKDISGIRIESATIKDVYKDVEKIKKIYEIENIKDYIKEPQGPYRSIHLIVKKDNKYSEIQIRTKNMTVLGDFMHDKVYKVPEELKGKIIKYQDEINDYLKTFSDYFHHKDGVNTGITEPPPCIEVIKITVGCL